MAIFGEDLIVEILVKLPVKSLLRFRCVCKSWWVLIKSPNFINMHLKHQSTKGNDCILIMRGLEDRSTRLSFHSYEALSVISSHNLQISQFDYFAVKVCGPCNGLLCISDGKTIAIYNPSMREFKVLPPWPFPCPAGWKVYVVAIGFGFDSNTNDYKVVAFFHLYFFNEDYFDKAGVYKLSTNSWREIERDHEWANMPYSPVCGTLFNGAFHWIAWSKGIHRVLLFDMSTEEFRYLELPHDDLLPEYAVCRHLTVLNESLALFTCTDPPDDSLEPFQFVDIWVMHEYGVGETWTHQLTIGPVTGIEFPLFLWKDEAILLESSEGQLVSCAIDTHEMNDLEIHGDWRTFGVMVYQESLISIK